MFQGSTFRPVSAAGFMPPVQMAGVQVVQARHAPRIAYQPPNLTPRRTMGQLEKLMGASMIVNALEVGIGSATAYLGIYNGINSKGPMKWLGWIVGVAGGVYALTALASVFGTGEKKQIVEKVVEKVAEKVPQ